MPFGARSPYERCVTSLISWMRLKPNVMYRVGCFWLVLVKVSVEAPGEEGLGSTFTKQNERGFRVCLVKRCLMLDVDACVTWLIGSAKR